MGFAPPGRPRCPLISGSIVSDYTEDTALAEPPALDDEEA